MLSGFVARAAGVDAAVNASALGRFLSASKEDAPRGEVILDITGATL